MNTSSTKRAAPLHEPSAQTQPFPPTSEPLTGTTNQPSSLKVDHPSNATESVWTGPAALAAPQAPSEKVEMNPANGFAATEPNVESSTSQQRASRNGLVKRGPMVRAETGKSFATESEVVAMLEAVIPTLSEEDLTYLRERIALFNNLAMRGEE